MPISGHPGTGTAGPAPGVAGMAISAEALAAIAETVTILLAGLGISGDPGGAAGGEYLGPFYLPYEYTSVPIETGNTNPFGIDPEQTTIITTGLTTRTDTMSIAIEIVQGTARDFPFQVTNPDGTTPTGIFLATDVSPPRSGRARTRPRS